MKQILLLISIVLLFFTSNANAQLKPAQSQYLVEKGVLINPSFEQGYKGWVITGCAKSLVTETPYLDKSLKLTCTNETFSIKQVSASLIDFKNQQGAFDLQIKTTASGVNIASITNGVRDNAYSVLDSTTFKRFKEIGFIVGDTDNGIEVYSDTNFTGEIIVDNFKLGLGNLTQEIGAAHFVGSLAFSGSSSSWDRNNAAWGKPAAVNYVAPTSIRGDVIALSSQEGGVEIVNPRYDGYYKVRYDGVLYNNTGAGTCYYALSKDDNLDSDNAVYTAFDTSARATTSMEGQFRFSSGETGKIFTIIRSVSAVCRIYAGGNGWQSSFSVHFFPDSKNTIATQDTELTAKTANDLTFTGSYVSGTTTHTLVDDIYGVVGSVTSLSSSGFRVNFASGLFTQTPKVNCEPHDSSGSQARFLVYSINTNSFTVQNYGFSGAVDTFDGSYDCTITKHSADYNKSQTIVGKFEQIRSDDLVKMRYTSNNSQVFGGGVIATIKYEDIESDNFNIYNTTTGIATIPHLGFYEVSCKTGTSAALGTNQTAQVLLETSLGRKSSDIIHGSGAASFFSNFASVKGVLLNQGDTVRCDWFSQAGVTLDTGAGHNFIEIIEQPDFKSVVANLMQGQATKCQTKYLNASVNTSGLDIADLQFNNLDISKHYNLTTQVRCVAGNVNCRLTAYDGNPASNLPISTTQNQPDAAGSEDRFTQTMQNPFFKPVNTFVTYRVSATASFLLEGTTSSTRNFYTWATLCELPETVIETTEFN